jgi:hypothetical protein
MITKLNHVNETHNTGGKNYGPNHIFSGRNLAKFRPKQNTERQPLGPPHASLPHFLGHLVRYLFPLVPRTCKNVRSRGGRFQVYLVK